LFAVGGIDPATQGRLFAILGIEDGDLAIVHGRQ